MKEYSLHYEEMGEGLDRNTFTSEQLKVYNHTLYTHAAVGL